MRLRALSPNSGNCRKQESVNKKEKHFQVRSGTLFLKRFKWLTDNSLNFFSRLSGNGNHSVQILIHKKPDKHLNIKSFKYSFYKERFLSKNLHWKLSVVQDRGLGYQFCRRRHRHLRHLHLLWPASDDLPYRSGSLKPKKKFKLFFIFYFYCLNKTTRPVVVMLQGSQSVWTWRVDEIPDLTEASSSDLNPAVIPKTNAI